MCLSVSLSVSQCVLMYVFIQLGISILNNAQFQNSLTYLNEADFIKVLTQYEEDQNVMNEVTNGRWTGRREIIPFLQMIQGNIHQKLLKRLGKTQTTLAISNCRGEGHTWFRGAVSL